MQCTKKTEPPSLKSPRTIGRRRRMRGCRGLTAPGQTDAQKRRIGIAHLAAYAGHISALIDPVDGALGENDKSRAARLIITEGDREAGKEWKLMDEDARREKCHDSLNRLRRRTRRDGLGRRNAMDARKRRARRGLLLLPAELGRKRGANRRANLPPPRPVAVGRIHTGLQRGTVGMDSSGGRRPVAKTGRGIVLLARLLIKTPPREGRGVAPITPHFAGMETSTRRKK